VFGDGLTQRQEPGTVCIARAIVLERLLGRLADHGSGIETRLAEPEVEDVLPLAFERLRTLEDLDSQEAR